MNKLLLGTWMVLLLLNMACTSSTDQDNSSFRVVTTTGMLGDLAKIIGGDSIEVLSLMGPGVDPHLYKATQGDLKRLQAADLIVYNGLHLEGKMGEVLEKLAQIKKVYALGEGVDQQVLLQDPIYPENFDPHIWFDVSIWSASIDGLLNILSEANPKHAEYFSSNAQSYREELDSLHSWVSTEVSSIPAEKRILVTAHDAFNYFGRAYGMEVKGLQGISTLSEFGLKDRVDLVNFLTEKKIKAVFVETSVSEKNINSIVEGCRQKGHDIQIGGQLFSDAMGPADTPEGTYVGMVRANVNTIVGALK